MGFAPPKDRSYSFQDYPRWLLWLRNVLANGELQLRGGCGQLEVLEVGCGWSGRGPGGRVCLVWLWDPGSRLQSVWGPGDRAQSVGLGVQAAGSSQLM